MAESARQNYLAWLHDHAIRGSTSEFSRMIIVAANVQLLNRLRDTLRDDGLRRQLRRVIMNARRHLAVVDSGLNRQELDEYAESVADALQDADCSRAEHLSVMECIGSLHQGMLFRDDASYRLPLETWSVGMRKLLSDRTVGFTNDVVRSLLHRWSLWQTENIAVAGAEALSDETRERIARKLDKEANKRIAMDGESDVESSIVGRRTGDETSRGSEEETEVATARQYLEQLTLPQLSRSIEGLSSTRRNGIACSSIDASNDLTRITDDLVDRYLELEKGITLKQALGLLQNSPKRVRHEVAKTLAPAETAISKPISAAPLAKITTLRDAESIRAEFLERFVFGEKKPNLPSYRKWLTRQSSKKFPTYESKRTVAAAANYFKNRFKVKFRFGPYRETVKLGVSRGSSGTGSFQLYFEPGVEESYVRVEFPELAAE